LEEEFNDWYDTEHFPQRKGLPGFESASRWVCIDGWPRWLALYDLESANTLRTPEYLAVSGSNSTPWSKRILPRTIGRCRVDACQVVPGDALTINSREIARLLLLRFPGVAPAERARISKQMNAVFEAMPGMTQLRLFEAASEDGNDVYVLVAFDRPFLLDTLLPAIAQTGRVDLVNCYVPYRRG
jgi:hypothetical protein